MEEDGVWKNRKKKVGKCRSKKGIRKTKKEKKKE